MATQRATPVAAGGFWHELWTAEGIHKEEARKHKLAQDFHRHKAEQYENSFGHAVNPLSWAVAQHHRNQEAHHKRHKEYHESRVSDAMTDEEKRDPQGRWTASFSAEGDRMEKSFRQVLGSGSEKAMRAWLIHNDPNGEYDDANARQLKQSMLRVWNTNKVRQRGKGMSMSKGKSMSRRQRYEARRKASAAMGIGALLKTAGTHIKRSVLHPIDTTVKNVFHPIDALKEVGETYKRHNAPSGGGGGGGSGGGNQKHDPSTGQFAGFNMDKGMTRRQRYEARRKSASHGKEMGVTGGVIGGLVGTIILPVVGTAIGAYIGHRLQERGIQARRTADALEILVKNAQQAQEVKQIAQEAGVKPVMKPGKSASMGAGSDLLKGAVHVAKNPKLVVDFASKAAAAAAASWLTARYCQAIVKGTTVAVVDFTANTISDIRLACRKFGGTLQAIGGPEPDKKKSASLAYGPGKCCGPNSRRAKYMAKCGKALATSPYGQDPNSYPNRFVNREGIEPEMSFSLLNHAR